MVSVDVNLSAVAIAAVVNIVLGFAWYGIFSKTWMKLMGQTEKDIKASKGKMPLNTAVSFIAAMALSYALTWIVDMAQATTAVEGATIGLLVGLGVVVTTSIPNYLWPGKPLKLFILDQTYTVLGMVVVGAIVAVL